MSLKPENFSEKNDSCEYPSFEEYKEKRRDFIKKMALGAGVAVSGSILSSAVSAGDKGVSKYNRLPGRIRVPDSDVENSGNITPDEEEANIEDIAPEEDFPELDIEDEPPKLLGLIAPVEPPENKTPPSDL